MRPALPGDYVRLVDIAVEGDSIDCDEHYLSFVANIGRLLCAATSTDVVAFGGMVPVDGAAMVTDLFVAAAGRGQGAGGQLLGELLADFPQRMTFSSQHEAALAAYRRAGMEPRSRMLYLSGPAVGGGAALSPSAWTHDRTEVVDYFAERGAFVTTNAVAIATDDGLELLRIDATDAIAECELLLRAFATGTNLRLYVPEAHPLAAWLRARGFGVVDHDVLCTTEGVELPTTLAALHPGLA